MKHERTIVRRRSQHVHACRTRTRVLVGTLPRHRRVPVHVRLGFESLQVRRFERLVAYDQQAIVRRLVGTGQCHDAALRGHALRLENRGGGCRQAALQTLVAHQQRQGSAWLENVQVIGEGLPRVQVVLGQGVLAHVPRQRLRQDERDQIPARVRGTHELAALGVMHLHAALVVDVTREITRAIDDFQNARVELDRIDAPGAEAPRNHDVVAPAAANRQNLAWRQQSIRQSRQRLAHVHRSRARCWCSGRQHCSGRFAIDEHHALIPSGRADLEDVDATGRVPVLQLAEQPRLSGRRALHHGVNQLVGSELVTDGEKGRRALRDDGAEHDNGNRRGNDAWTRRRHRVLGALRRPPQCGAGGGERQQERRIDRPTQAVHEHDREQGAERPTHEVGGVKDVRVLRERTQYQRLHGTRAHEDGQHEEQERRPVVRERQAQQHRESDQHRRRDEQQRRLDPGGYARRMTTRSEVGREAAEPEPQHGERDDGEADVILQQDAADACERDFERQHARRNGEEKNDCGLASWHLASVENSVGMIRARIGAVDRETGSRAAQPARTRTMR